jgi:hypothetical protein
VLCFAVKFLPDAETHLACGFGWRSLLVSNYFETGDFSPADFAAFDLGAGDFAAGFAEPAAGVEGATASALACSII